MFRTDMDLHAYTRFGSGRPTRQQPSSCGLSFYHPIGEHAGPRCALPAVAE